MTPDPGLVNTESFMEASRSAGTLAQVYSHGRIQWKQFAAPINPSVDRDLPLYEDLGELPAVNLLSWSRGGLVNG